VRAGRHLEDATGQRGDREHHGLIFDIAERRAAEQLRLQTQTEAVRVEELEASRSRFIAAADQAAERGSARVPVSYRCDHPRRLSEVRKGEAT
jgi:hypothetical protein